MSTQSTINCDRCGRRFKDQTCCEDHIKHPEPESDCRNYVVCDHCHILFKTLRRLYEHFYEKHSGDDYRDNNTIFLRKNHCGALYASRPFSENRAGDKHRYNEPIMLRQNHRGIAVHASASRHLIKSSL